MKPIRSILTSALFLAIAMSVLLTPSTAMPSRLRQQGSLITPFRMQSPASPPADTIYGTDRVLTNSLLAVAEFADGVKLVTVNPTTGQIDPVGTGSGAPSGTSPAQGISALDAPGHRYFFSGFTGSSHNLFVIDTQTGVLLQSPSLSWLFTSLEFDTTSNTLLGVVSFADGTKVVTVDPTTGQVNPVGTGNGAPSGISPAQGISALDMQGHRYFFRGYTGSSHELFVLDTQTSILLQNPPLPLLFTSLEFDSTSNTLLGVVSFSDGTKVVTIDPTTGQVNPVGTGSGTPPDISPAQGISALDVEEHRFYFRGYTDSTQQLFALDTQTGNLLQSPTLPIPFASLELDVPVWMNPSLMTLPLIIR